MIGRFLAVPAAAVCLLISCVCTAGEPAPVPYRIVNRIAGRDGGWDFASVDAVNGRIYIARADAIERIDIGNRTVTDALAPARRAHAVLVLDGGATVFETDGETGLGRFVATADGKVLAEVATGTKPDAAFLDPATGLIAVMNAGDGTIAVVDPKTRTLAGKIAVGGGLEFGVPDGAGGGFVNIEDKSEIARIDLRTRRRTGTIALPGCDGPTGLALVANGTRLITACANRVALVVDTKTGKTVATFTIGDDPDAVLVDAQRGLAFIPCGGTGTLVAIAIADPSKIAVVAVIPTQRGAKTGAIDPRDGRIYLPTATLAPAAAGAKRGKAIPGTFAVLVLAPAQKGQKAFQYLAAGSFAPDRSLPAPPVKDGPIQAVEIARIHALIDGASPQRKVQAKADAENESPSIFDGATGHDLASLPNTWALLRLVQAETDIAIDQSKVAFDRTRPWGVDPTIHPCEDVTGKKPHRGYPSGHAGLAYSVGWTLAHLMPDRAPAILARAQDYAVSREICGAHFASDTEASHVIGTLSASSLIADPRLAGLVETTRAELAQ